MIGFSVLFSFAQNISSVAITNSFLLFLPDGRLRLDLPSPFDIPVLSVLSVAPLRYCVLRRSEAEHLSLSELVSPLEESFIIELRSLKSLRDTLSSCCYISCMLLSCCVLILIKSLIGSSLGLQNLGELGLSQSITFSVCWKGLTLLKFASY